MDQYTNELGQPIGHPMPDWQPCPWPEKIVLEGQYCRLEPVQPEKHAENLYKALMSSEQSKNWTYLLDDPFTSFEEFLVWMELIATKDDPFYFVVIDLRTNEPVGIASYLRINPEHGCIEVGHIHFSPLMQRTPISTEAMFLMMRYVFDELGYRRYEWKCDSLNQPSRNAALRYGFTFEGVFRQLMIYKNRSRDTAWFSIIDKEWLEQKQRFESWLDQDNFDEQGRQIKRLQDC